MPFTDWYEIRDDFVTVRIRFRYLRAVTARVGVGPIGGSTLVR